MIRAKDSVDFDPKNPEHVLAIKTLLDTGKLHPTLRFHLDPEMSADEEGKKSPRYTSTLSMALFKMAYAHMESVQEKVGNPHEEDTSPSLAGGVVRQLPVKQHGHPGTAVANPGLFGTRKSESPSDETQEKIKLH